jgi:hypothetical protein
MKATTRIRPLQRGQTAVADLPLGSRSSGIVKVAAQPGQVTFIADSS